MNNPIKEYWMVGIKENFPCFGKSYVFRTKDPNVHWQGVKRETYKIKHSEKNAVHLQIMCL